MKENKQNKLWNVLFFIIPICCIIVLSVGLFFYFNNSGDSESSDDNESSREESTQNEPSEDSSTLDDSEGSGEGEGENEDEKTETDVPSVTEPVLSPESAVDIYMANKNLWMENPEFMPMQRYGYCLIDLDFDGVLELINSSNDGSGRYSNNKFYRINVEKLTVEEFHADEIEESGLDYYFQSKQAKLLKNRSDGKMFYIFTDFTRINASEYGTIYFEVYLKNKELYENSLFSDYHGLDYESGGDTEVNKYFISKKEVSKSEYELITKSFYEQNEDLNLVWKYVLGPDFDKANYSNQKQLLLEAYRSFSYNGFSFGDVETYDVELEETKADSETAKKYSMADYRGMTIKDVTELWGSDYTILKEMIGGGWCGIYYDDNRCPFIFCFSAFPIPTSCSGNEVLSGIVAYPVSKGDDFFVIDSTNIRSSYSEVSKKLKGTYYFSELENAYAYNCELTNGDVIGFTWKNISGAPIEIRMSFELS